MRSLLVAISLLSFAPAASALCPAHETAKAQAPAAAGGASLTDSAAAAKKPETATPPTSAHGSKITRAEATPLKAALAEAAKSPDREFLVIGTAKKVCQAKGCWMVLDDGTAEVRVTFADYAFFVPKDSTGRKLRAQGRIETKQETVAQLKHILEDAGAPKEEIEKVKKPKTVHLFVASGVEFLN